MQCKKGFLVPPCAALFLILAFNFAGQAYAGGPTFYTWNGTDDDWFNASAWIPNGTPGGGDVVTINSGNVTLNSNSSINTLNLNGGSILGTGTLTVGGSCFWSGGTMSGTGTTSIPVSATITLDTADLLLDTGRTLDIGGTATFNLPAIDTLFIQNGSSVNIQSGALFDCQSDASITNDTGAGSIFNSGTFQKSGGTGVTQVKVSLNNSSNVNATSGTLQFFADGSHTGVFDAALGCAISFISGIHDMGSGTNWTGSETVTTAGIISIDGATVAFNTDCAALNVNFTAGTIEGPNGIYTTGAFNWTGGTMIGIGYTEIDGTLAMNGSLNIYLNNRELDIIGTAAYAPAGGELFLQNGGTINIQNGGHFDCQNDTPIGDLSNGYIANSGTFVKSGGTGTSLIEPTLDNSSSLGGKALFAGTIIVDGTVQAQTGILQLAGGGSGNGTMDAQDGARISFSANTRNASGSSWTTTGTGIISIDGATISINNNLVADNVEFTSGLIQGNSAMNVNKSFAWHGGGTMDGIGTVSIMPGATMAMSGAASLTVNNGWSLDLAGDTTYNMAASANLYLENDSQLTIQGGVLFDCQSDSSILNVQGSSTIANSGTFLKSGGTGTETISPTFNNAGIVRASSGTLQFNTDGGDTGTFDATSGAKISFAGGVRSQNSGTVWSTDSTSSIGLDGANVTIVVDITCGNVEMSGGTLDGAGNLTVTQSLVWGGGGTMSGAVATTLGANATLTLQGNADLVLDNGRTLDLANAAVSTLAAGKSLLIQNGSAVKIEFGALFDFQTDTFLNNTAGNGTVTNLGTFMKSSGTGTLTVVPAFTNSGNVETDAGTLNFAGGYVQNNGSTLLRGGNLAGNLNILSGILSGSGVIAGNVRNSGSFNLGPNIGTLSIGGNYIQTGNLNLRIGGLTPGTEFDSLAVTGPASFGGSLSLFPANGFTPSQSNTFKIFTVASESGAFSTVVNHGAKFTPVYNSADVTLNVGAAPGITSDLQATGVQGMPFSYAITASGVTPITFSASPLPSGLSLSNNIISGAASLTGRTNVMLTAGNGSGTDTKILVIDIHPNPTKITSPLTVTGTVGAAFTYTLTASGTQPFTYSFGTLPAGLTSNSNVISGTPTLAGVTLVSMTASNPGGADTNTLSITIAPITITSAATASGVAGQPFSYTITTDGPGPVAYGASPLPSGLVLSSSGVISGTPTLAGSFNLALTASSSLGNTQATLNIVVVPGTPALFVVAGFPNPSPAGSAGAFSVTVTDAFGNKNTGYTGTATFTSSDSLATLPASYAFTAADAGTKSFSATLKTSGAQTLAATDTAALLTGTQSNIVVVPASAVILKVAGFGTPAVAGTAGNFTVTAKDQFGNTAAGYAGTIHFTTSDGAAAVPADYTFTAADSGVKSFSAMLKTVGIQSLSATDTSAPAITGAQTGIIVNPSGIAPPVLGALTASLNPAPTAVQVDFNIDASDPSGLPLAFAWNFGDGTVVNSSNIASHTYSSAGIFTVTCVVTNSLALNSATLALTVVAPSSEGSGTTNISEGALPVVDPFTNLGISVVYSSGGVIQLQIDVSQLRGAFDISTDFAGISTVSGDHPVHKFDESGIFVATTTAIEPVVRKIKGKGRKTLIISRKETGQAPLVKNTVEKKLDATVTKVTGKFVLPGISTGGGGALTAPKSDIVTYTGTIELPEGFDVSAATPVSVGIGNIVDDVTVDSRGRGSGKGNKGRIKGIRINYPKVGKGSTLTKAGQKAKIAITMVSAGMVAGGFDTEGVGANPTTNKLNIQLDLLVAGVPYELSVPVNLFVSRDSALASISSQGTH